MRVISSLSKSIRLKQRIQCFSSHQRFFSGSSTIFSTDGIDFEDPFLLQRQLSDEEVSVSNMAKEFSRENLAPRVLEGYRNESFDPKIMKEFGEAGLLGSTVGEEFGGAGVNYVSYGLIAREVERVDSGYRSAMSVQSSLVIGPIHQFGSEKQKKELLPRLIKGELIGCFGLTEPDFGSDAGGMATTAVRVKGTSKYKLSGSKTWITNSPIADVFVIWAKVIEDESQDRIKAPIRGIVLERSKVKGLETPAIKNKLSLRASLTGSIFMQNVEIDESDMFVSPKSLAGPFFCLNNARYGISWGAMGAAENCFHIARDYVLNRKQFGKELARMQLVQFKLAEMVTDISLGIQASLRVGRLFDEAKNDSSVKVPPEMISLIKRNNCIKALDTARKARDMLGGNGIADEYHVMRHAINLETVNTYEGTQDVHALILGRAITDFQAFVPK